MEEINVSSDTLRMLYEDPSMLLSGSLSDRVGNNSSFSLFKYLPQPQHLVMKGGAGRYVSLPATR